MKEFLERAERYAEARGDSVVFNNIYRAYRQSNGITDSVWKTLAFLYGNNSADLLEFQ